MSVFLNKKVDNLKFHIEQFNSAEEVVQTCRNRKLTSSSFKDRSKNEDISRSFCMVESYDEALDLMKNGYQKTTDELKVLMNARGVEPKRIKFQNELAGFAPIVPLALQGVPNCMIGMTMKPIKCKVLDIYYDMTASCSVDAEDLLEAGRKLLKSIISLEKQGYRFNLYTVQDYSDRSTSDMVVIKIKSSDRPLDLKRLSFTMTHPAFFRVIGFDWYSKVPDGKYRSGYGHSFVYDKNEKEVISIGKQLFGENSIFISATSMLRKNDNEVKEVIENAGKNR